MKFFLKLIQEFLIHICNNGKILFALAFHELSNHNFKRVFWHKATYNKIIALFSQSFFLIPAHQFFIIVSQLTKGKIRTVRNEGCFRTTSFDALTVIAFMDVLFDIHRITDCKVATFDHHLLRNLPILTNRCGPSSPHPLMPIGIQVYCAAQFMNFFVEMCRKRSDATRHYVDNRVRNMIFPDMFAASL